MELAGKVVLVPRDREGWGGASEIDVPCVVRRFVKGATRTKKTKSKQSYYEVDSLYLKAHYPLLARRHGWSWRWSAREVESFVCRELETADEPDRRVHARSNKKKMTKRKLCQKKKKMTKRKLRQKKKKKKMTKRKLRQKKKKKKKT